FAILGLVSVFLIFSLAYWCRRKRFKSGVSTHNKQFNRDKKLAGFSLRSILAHNFLPVNRALGFRNAPSNIIHWHFIDYSINTRREKNGSIKRHYK
ncbi:hypothetical protein, partial [Pseudoalteromonas phenolica]|uniref:hypothetical protein n=1 Tax=Pseudoalteromonas phenolica TaxID=161398 RepID=UPI001BB26106